MTRTCYAICLALSACIAAPSVARGGYIYLDYLANPLATLPVGVSDPALYGWIPTNAVGAGSPVINDNGLSVNAWRLSDSSTSGANPSYLLGLGSQASADALQFGFRFEAHARYIGDFGTAGNMGLTVFLNRRAYNLMFDLNAAGDLQATLAGRAGSTVLTSGGTGALAYHRFTLESSGGQNVTATFDGQPIGAAWPGIQTAVHPDIVQWGNSAEARTARGTMAFHEVTFEVGPIVDLPADADGDADVDGGDFLTWQRTLGSRTQLAADANADGIVGGGDLPVWRQEFGSAVGTIGSGRAAPEPACALLAVWASLAMPCVRIARARCRRS
jgi:hypothetical protein